MNIPDNYDRWKQYDAEQQAKLEKMPVCSICEEHIQEDRVYVIDGDIVCPYCLEEEYGHNVEELMED